MDVWMHLKLTSWVSADRDVCDQPGHVMQSGRLLWSNVKKEKEKKRSVFNYLHSFSKTNQINCNLILCHMTCSLCGSHKVSKQWRWQRVEGPLWHNNNSYHLSKGQCQTAGTHRTGWGSTETEKDRNSLRGHLMWHFYKLSVCTPETHAALLRFHCCVQ